MRILLISPSDDFFVNYSTNKKSVCVALPLLAAYTPREHEIIVADQGYGENVYYEGVDLVGISAMTSQAKAGYRIAAHYRDKGIPVVMGGIHASVLPEEVSRHVDAVCVGEGDALWGRIIEDAAAGKLQKTYKADTVFPMDRIPPMRLDVVNFRRTTFSHTVIQASRGCPYSCEFCTTSAMFGNRYRFRPVDHIVEELKKNRGNMTFFVDDNIFGSPAYAEELFKKMMPLKVRWFSQASLNSMARDPSLLKLARKSGALGFFIGIESVNAMSRDLSNSWGKLGSSNLSEVSRKIRIILDHGLLVQTSVVFGLDGDDPSTFEKTVDFLKRSRVSIASFCILTPYPGTRIHSRLKEEGRLIHEDWSKYSNENVCFYPKGMTPQQLKDGSDWAGRQFYSWRSIVRRAPASRRRGIIYTLVNSFTRRDNLRNHGPGAIIPMSREEKLRWRAA